MRALRYHGRRDFRVDEVAEPEVGPGTVRVDVEWCGICGSELHEYTEGPISVPATEPHPVTGQTVPVILGHEFAGTVSDVADDVHDVAVGDRVAVEPLVYCGSCDFCSRGHHHLCQRLAIIGIPRRRGRVLRARGRPVLHRPPVAGERLHRAGRAGRTPRGGLARDAQSRLGQTALVVGAGPIGLATLLCPQAAGAGLTAVSVRRAGARKEAAMRLHADAVLDAEHQDVAQEVLGLTQGRGVDVVFETAGTQEAMDVALDAVRVGGTIVSLAVWAAPGRCDDMRLLLKEVTLVGSMCYSNVFPTVISALSDGRIQEAERMITKRVDLEDAVQGGFQSLADDKGQHVKVLVRPGAAVRAPL